ncbi:MAG TPA: DsbA family protein, partial [Caulobacteraceae bacterium]|nr:DsbA family protein [Caulobacteraceae bacterium]
KAMRACIVLEPHGRLVDFATAVFEAYWGEDQDISKDEVLREVCARVGIDADRLFTEISAQSVNDQLKANTDEVMARGGFGSPTIFVGGDDMYFGNDRLPLVWDALMRAREKVS